MKAPPELDASHRREINQALDRLQKVLGRFDQYEACGVDCADWRAHAQYLAAELQKVIDHIYEGKPAPLEV